MSSEPSGTLPRLEPERDPRPQDDEGTYRCYTNDCTNEADIARPRRIASTSMDPVETIITICFRCECAFETLKETRDPLATAVKVEESVAEEFGDQGWNSARLYPRLLANIVLYDDPRGRDPPSEDSPLGDIFEHAGKRGEELREKLETPIEDQLLSFDSYDLGDDEDHRPSEETTFSDFGDP